MTDELPGVQSRLHESDGAEPDRLQHRVRVGIIRKHDDSSLAPPA